MGQKIVQEYWIKDKGSGEFKKVSKKVQTQLNDMEKKAKKSSKNMANAFSKVKIGLAAVGVAAGLAAVKLKSISSELIDYGDKLHKLNLRLGVSVEMLDKLKKVGELAGVEFKSITNSIQRLTVRVQEAALGTGLAKDALKGLGISIENIKNMSPEKQFLLVAERIGLVTDKSLQNKMAFDLMGRGGAELISMFKDLKKQLDNTNTTMNQETADAMALYNDNWTILKNNLIDNVMPVLGEVTKQINNLLFGDPLSIGEEIKILEKEIEGLKSPDMVDEANLMFSLDTNKEILKVKEKELKILKDRLFKKKELANWEKIEQDRLTDIIKKASEKLSLEKKTTEERKKAAAAEELISKALKESLKKANEIQKNYIIEDEENYKAYVDNRIAADLKILDELRNNLAISSELKTTAAEEDKARIAEMNQLISTGLTNEMLNIADGTKSAKEAFKDFAKSFLRNIAEMIIQAQIFKAIEAVSYGDDGSTTAIGALFGAVSKAATPKSAKGNVFNQGNLVPFANGGIVKHPTIFPMAKGTGLMGEAGPEAILPLTRTSTGNLGVESAGGEGNGGVTNVIIQAMDSESFNTFAMRNQGTFSGVLADMANKGNTGFKKSIQKAMR